MDPYRYSPLSKFDNIRLLQVLPGRDPKKLRCKLLEYPLRSLDNSCHLYESLSYVWGSEDKPQSIIIDDLSELKITQNLYNGLCRLQNSSFPRILWVDAICINQSDDTEKQHQIPLMAEIYANASHVLVWLGEAEDCGGQALIAINHVGQTSRKHVSHAEIDRNQILKLLQRPWFQRIWVLQEAAAARRISIMCGSVEIDGHAFCLGLDSLDAVLEGSMTHISFLIRGAIFRSRETLRNQKRLSLNICSLSELLDMYHANKATIRHDKVFALLGMCSDDLESAGLDPNYDLEWKELMRRLVIYILGSQVSIDTWEDKEMAFIKSDGHIIGKVISVENDEKGGRQKLKVKFEKPAGFHNTKSVSWDLPKSAIPVLESDYICLLDGTSKPTIIRPCDGYFVIIMIAAVPLETDQIYVEASVTNTEPLVSEFATREFSLVWDWERASGWNVGLGNYDNLIQTSMWGLSETGLRSQMRNAMRLWNFAQILEDIGEIRREEEIGVILSAGEVRLKAAEAYAIALGEEQSQIPIQILSSGMTILSWAAFHGHGQFVRVLLETGKLNVNERDIYGRTPLFLSVYYGREDVVELLLATGKVNVNRLYVRQKDMASPNTRCKGGEQTPLWLAAESKGQTPLWFAAQNGHEGVIKLLLATNKVNFNIMERPNCTTPLAIAAKNGYEGVVKLLLGTGKFNVVVRGSWHNQPLQLATENGHDEIFRLLATTNKVNINSEDRTGTTLLSRAARKGDEKMVKLLLTIDGISVDSKDKEGRTPLSWAAGIGHEEIVKVLLESGKVDVNAEDITSAERTKLGKSEHWILYSNNWTPLLWAVYMKHEGIVRQLLAIDEVNVDARDSDGRTSLRLAVIARHEGIIKLLLATGKADVSSKVSWGGDLNNTPLDMAVRYNERADDGTVDTIFKLFEPYIKPPKPPRPRGLARLLKSITGK